VNAYVLKVHVLSGGLVLVACPSTSVIRHLEPSSIESFRPRCNATTGNTLLSHHVPLSLRRIPQPAPTQPSCRQSTPSRTSYIAACRSAGQDADPNSLHAEPYYNWSFGHVCGPSLRNCATPKPHHSTVSTRKAFLKSQDGVKSRCSVA
jgi:hypothetical protein